MKKYLLLIAVVLTSLGRMNAAYDIRINLKNCKDTIAFLVKYTWDQKFIVDTCKNVRNGQIHFAGKEDLDKGIYMLVSQATTVYFEFFVNDTQKLTINGDASDPTSRLSVTGSKENTLFFEYMHYVSTKNKEFGKVIEQTKGMKKEDSTKFVQGKIREFMAEAKKFDM